MKLILKNLDNTFTSDDLKLKLTNHPDVERREIRRGDPERVYLFMHIDWDLDIAYAEEVVLDVLQS
jgi:hypothetical protein